MINGQDPEPLDWNGILGNHYQTINCSVRKDTKDFTESKDIIVTVIFYQCSGNIMPFYNCIYPVNVDILMLMRPVK